MVNLLTSQGHLLVMLVRHHPVSYSDLADRMCLARRHVVRLVAELAKAGLVVRDGPVIPGREAYWTVPAGFNLAERLIDGE